MKKILFIGCFSTMLLFYSCVSLSQIGLFHKKTASSLKWRTIKMKNPSFPQVSGKVVDKETRFEIPFACISLTNKLKTYYIQSDNSGCFASKESIIQGFYRVSCGYIGYESLVYDSLYIKKDKVTSINIHLRSAGCGSSYK